MTGSVRVVSDGPISAGVLRFDLPDIGVAGVGASPPVRDAIFPVRRQEGGSNTGVATHNLESSPELVRCELMREGVLRDAVSIPLKANGRTPWFIEGVFTGTDTSDFGGSVRGSAPEGDCSSEWPWSWMPATASSPHCRWCRCQRGLLGNRVLFQPRCAMRHRVARKLF